MYEFHLFAGIGGGILGGLINGNICVGAVEIEEYPRKILVQRQIDGCLPIFPIWDDVRTFRADNDECRWFIDYLRSIKDDLCICGGFPCQDISSAGKGAGIDGERSGLWREFKRIICEIRPRNVFIENSPMLTIRGGVRVIADLAEMGYDAKWGIISASDCGAWHLRERFWCRGFSNAGCIGRESATGNGKSKKLKKRTVFRTSEFRSLCSAEKAQYEVKSEDQRMADGIPYFMERFTAIGNAQVPIVASVAERILE